MEIFTWGLLAMGAVIAALFFLRYWRESGERLFGFFALAFAGLAANWTGLAIIDHPAAEARQEYAYVVRLLAFVILLFGILDKNRRSGRL